MYGTVCSSGKRKITWDYQQIIKSTRISPVQSVRYMIQKGTSLIKWWPWHNQSVSKALRMRLKHLTMFQLLTPRSKNCLPLRWLCGVQWQHRTYIREVWSLYSVTNIRNLSGNLLKYDVEHVRTLSHMNAWNIKGRSVQGQITVDFSAPYRDSRFYQISIKRTLHWLWPLERLAGLPGYFSWST